MPLMLQFFLCGDALWRAVNAVYLSEVAQDGCKERSKTADGLRAVMTQQQQSLRLWVLNKPYEVHAATVANIEASNMHSNTTGHRS